MNSDLIFHAVSRRKWPTLTKEGYYSSEDIEETEGILCSKKEYLKEYMNEYFKGRKNLIILVIDSSRLTTGIKEKTEKTVVVSEGINVDAILDKIRIDCSEDGTFDIDVAAE